MVGEAAEEVEGAAACEGSGRGVAAEAGVVGGGCVGGGVGRAMGAVLGAMTGCRSSFLAQALLAERGMAAGAGL